MTVIDKLNELGQALGIKYRDTFGENAGGRELKGALDSSLWPLHKRHDRKTPSCLYHYTSQKSAFSILSTRTLRVTDAFFLNDITEIRHGAAALKEALSKLKGSGSAHFEAIKSAVDFLTDPFDVENRNSYQLHRGNAYVVSFSTKDDDVSQWQKYAVYHGVSLGFRVDLLAKVTLADCNGKNENETSDIEALLAPVIYANVNDLAELLFQDMSALRGLDQGSEFNSEKRDQLIGRYACFMSLMKQPAFSGENEWRLLITLAQSDRGRACWQPGESYARPYATLGFGDKGKDCDKNDSTAPDCLRQYCDIRINAQDYDLARHYFDFLKIDVSKSASPLRPQ